MRKISFILCRVLYTYFYSAGPVKCFQSLSVVILDFFFFFCGGGREGWGLVFKLGIKMP